MGNTSCDETGRGGVRRILALAAIWLVWVGFALLVDRATHTGRLLVEALLWAAGR